MSAEHPWRTTVRLLKEVIPYWVGRLEAAAAKLESRATPPTGPGNPDPTDTEEES